MILGRLSYFCKEMWSIFWDIDDPSSTFQWPNGEGLQLDWRYLMFDATTFTFPSDCTVARAWGK